jgi:phosphopantothenoylcysteine decarboxylase/phosphopantothenate--cysteine ligase
VPGRVRAPRCTPRCGSTPPREANVATLRERGALVLEPAEGRLTGADSGKGRLPEPDEIFDVCLDVLAAGVGRPDLAGRQVVVSAGGTREYLDPVRFLGNRSSGLQGYALARGRRAAGAEVTLVAANTRCPTRPASRWSGSRPPSSCEPRCSAAARPPTPW